MGLVLGQRSVGTVATFITAVPAGPYSIMLYVGTATSVAIGTASTVTSSNGAVIPAGGNVTLIGYEGSQASSIYGIASAAVTVSYFLSDDDPPYH